MGDDSTAEFPEVPQLVAERVSANLREARRDAGLTQEQLAELSEVDHFELERLERGATLPYLDTVVRLAGALDVPPAKLCAGVVWGAEHQRFE